jgi:hypothetical protein
MARMTLASQPDFVDVPDASFAVDEPVTDDLLVKVNNNAKFGAVRCEYIYMGFYVNGDTVGTPVSPVDGYAYSREEILYLFTLCSTRSPGTGFVSGQASPPNSINGSQAANLLYFLCDIDDASGNVSIETHYYKQGGAETFDNQGFVKVYALCQRQSVNETS